MKAANLKCEHMENPIGIDASRPVLSWIAQDGKQTAYEIRVMKGDTCVCSLPKTDGSAACYSCDFEIEPKTRYTWAVRLYDENDSASELSEAYFETGITDSSLWKAKWIDPETEGSDPEVRKPAGCLKKTFRTERVHLARLYITAHGVYTVFINGVRMEDFILAPGTDDYHKRLQVQTYDISPLLKEGENEILVYVGDGWYRGNVGIDGLHNYYGNDIALLCQIENDGEVIAKSDETWLCSNTGPIRENDLQIGETYDARMEEIHDWHPVKVRDYSFENLCASNSTYVSEHERFEGKLLITPAKETVIDYGQNLAGYTEFEVNAHEGDVIVIYHGETLDENGNFTQDNFAPGERNTDGIPQRIIYTCKEGKNVYKPHFMISGFRYAKVETEIDLSSARFTAVAVYSEMEQTGKFECGNDDVNRLFLNSLWSMRSNFCDIPTDCPTRERAGWTGDAGAFVPSAVYLADCYPVFRKWLAECRLAQKEDGLVQNIAPVNNSGSMISNMLQGSSGWGDACILVPWMLYETYGDPSILEENYEMMKGWMEFSARRAASATRDMYQDNPWKEYLADQGFHFGEWLEPGANTMAQMQQMMAVGAPEVATAYYHQSAKLMAKTARILNKEEDAQRYDEMAEKTRLAYRFTCTDEGKITSQRQCEYVRPIAFGLLDADEVKEAAYALNQLVINNGYHLNTGFLSTPYLCQVLSENGYTDTAYRLLLQEECPGWLYEVKKGATSIWETWDGIREDGSVHDSLNHYTYGAISGWLFSGVCGISLKEGNLTIAPHPHPSLHFAEAEWNSPKGKVISCWKYEGNTVIFDITVPKEALLRLPDGSIHNVQRGEHHYEILL